MVLCARLGFKPSHGTGRKALVMGILGQGIFVVLGPLSW